MLLLASALTLFAAAPANSSGRVYPARVYTTVRLQGETPRIDGRLDDSAWQQGEWSGDFKQQMPTEGAPPSQATQLKILYDERNVYVAIRAHDDPALIHRWPGRRDEFVGDIAGICFDSYNDKRTGFEFDLTAGGSKIDLVLGNGESEWDTTWDAVWHGATALEADAWTAELQIPLSQLRYGPEEEQVWGLHVWRWIDRNQEEVQWQLIPRQNTGRMHQLGELRGIKGLKPARRLELLPHVLGRAARGPSSDGTRAGSGSLGLDVKLGLTTNFTLDATVNPDFGQVEADPSVMNLTAYETFFEERRPFFLEGRSILGFGIGDGDSLFYSRRIGHAPSFSPDLETGETARPPEGTTILGAAKITGKTPAGLSIGVVQSLTQRELARITSPTGHRDELVEPQASYTVARVHRDWDKGNTSLGGMFTFTRRGSDGGDLAFLPDSALTGGLDFSRYFANRSWFVEAKALASRVTGAPEAIGALQTNAVHYYQRPDAGHLELDPDATALSGHGGSLRFGRTDKGRLRLITRFFWYSPGLDLNDVGYLRQADLLSSRTSLGWNVQTPKGPFRVYAATLTRGNEWNFDGLSTWGSTELDVNGQLRNKWIVVGGLRWIETPVDTRRLRGGPALRQDSFLCTNVSVETDSSRRLGATLAAHGHFHREGLSRQSDLSSYLWVRPTRTLRLSANASYSRNRDDLEYVATAEADASATAGAEPRYILGRIAQRTWALTFRASLSLSPGMTLQYYGNPFASTGRYSQFKGATDTLAAAYTDRFRTFADGEVAYRPETNSYDAADPSGAAYSFSNPDFSFRQFHSNLVLRWEWRPGAALYAVWSQGRTGSDPAWAPGLGTHWDALWRTRADNVFLIKLSYWFSP